MGIILHGYITALYKIVLIPDVTALQALKKKKKEGKGGEKKGKKRKKKKKEGKKNLASNPGPKNANRTWHFIESLVTLPAIYASIPLSCR